MKIVLSKCSFWCIGIALYLKLEKDKLPLSGTLLLVLPKWQKFLILIGLFKTAHQWATFTFFSVCASENSWWIASYFLNKMTGNWKFVYFLSFFSFSPFLFFFYWINAMCPWIGCSAKSCYFTASPIFSLYHFFIPVQLFFFFSSSFHWCFSLLISHFFSSLTLLF